MGIARLVDSLFSIYWWILIVSIFLTWIPTIDWYKQPFKFMRDVTEPLLSPFRRIIPPLSGLDLSPIIALLFLQFARTAIIRLLLNLGL